MCILKIGLERKKAMLLVLRCVGSFSPLRLRTLQWPRGPPRMQDAISDAEIPRLHVQLLKRRASMPNATAKAGAPPLSRLPKGPVQANDGVQNQS